MTTDTTYIELLKMAHESLDSKDKQIAEFQGEFEKLQGAYQTLAQEDDKKSDRIKELEKEHFQLVKALKLIENSPFNIDGFDSSNVQAFNMQEIATKTLNQLTEND
jgi:predicted nuclease with TOPRIM domain